MKILHLSADYPDPLRPDKTRAVANLLDLVPEHRHLVYSLNRTAPWHAVRAHPFGTGHCALGYGAARWGVGLRRAQRRLVAWIAEDLAARGERPDLVHAHKISVEGPVGAGLAEIFGVPLILSAQGNSDIRIIRARPDLRRLWRRIWQRAAHVLPFAPWTATELEALLGPRFGPMDCLPCPTTADAALAPRETPPIVRAVFGLDQWRNKGAAELVAAARQIARFIPGFRLEFIGAGSKDATTRLSGMIRGERSISLRGAVGHDRIPVLLNNAAMVAMPSARESYGMVLAEALLAGCPVLHGVGNAISGYLPGAPFAVQSRRAPRSLAAAMREMILDQKAIKASLAAAQVSGALERFRRPAIATVYRRALTGVAGDLKIAA